MTTVEDDPRPFVDADRYFSEHPEFEACRKQGHHWSRFLPAGKSFVIENEGTADEMWLKYRECVDDPDTDTPGCGQKHYKRWDRNGNELTPDRDYPEDYVLNGERMPTRGELLEADVKAAQQSHRERKAPKRSARSRRPAATKGLRRAS